MKNYQSGWWGDQEPEGIPWHIPVRVQPLSLWLSWRRGTMERSLWSLPWTCWLEQCARTASVWKKYLCSPWMGQHQRGINKPVHSGQQLRFGVGMSLSMVWGCFTGAKRTSAFGKEDLLLCPKDKPYRSHPIKSLERSLKSWWCSASFCNSLAPPGLAVYKVQRALSGWKALTMQMQCQSSLLWSFHVPTQITGAPSASSWPSSISCITGFWFHFHW